MGSDCEIKLGYNSDIEIGKNCTFSDHILLSAGECSKIQIGDNCAIRKNSRIYSLNKLIIGKGSTFGNNLHIVAGLHAPIVIGEECLFSYYIKIRSDNGHSIFDLDKKENIHMKRDSYIYLDKHIWVGMGASILGSTKIGRDSIIGANSLVKGKFPENVMIAGTPAHVIKEHVAWDRKKNLSYEDWIKNKIERGC